MEGFKQKTNEKNNIQETSEMIVEFEEKKGKRKNKNTKNTRLKVFRFIIIAFMILICFSIFYLRKNKSLFSTIDYKELCNLIISDKLYVSILNVEYNFEKYSLQDFADKYSRDIEGFIEKEEFFNKNMNMIRKDFCDQFDEKTESFIESYYFIEQNNFFIVAFVRYENLEIYNAYCKNLTNLAMNIQITQNTNLENENLFTNLLTQYNIPEKTKILEYEKIANQESPYKIGYEKLTDIQKEIYDEIYTVLIEKKEEAIIEPYKYEQDDFSYAVSVLDQDLMYYGIGGHYLQVEYYMDESTDRDVWKCYLYPLFSDEEYKIAEQICDKIIDEMPKGLSTFGKYKYLADSICQIAKYDYDNEGIYAGANIYSMLGVFIDGIAVEKGYAEAYEYLCKKAGLYCDIFYGYNDQICEYNYIMLGDKYYFVDVASMDQMGEVDNFAFSYHENMQNWHDDYYKGWYENYYKGNYGGLEESLLKGKKIIDNLGILNWYEIKYMIHHFESCE